MGGARLQKTAHTRHLPAAAAPRGPRHRNLLCLPASVTSTNSPSSRRAKLLADTAFASYAPWPVLLILSHMPAILFVQF